MMDPPPGAVAPRLAPPPVPKSRTQRLARRGRQWTGILSAFFTAQSLSQLAGLGAGLLLVNFLAVREYALYTLALSVVSFFHFVTDLGATSSLLYFTREARRQGDDPGRYLAAVLSLRWRAFACGAALVSLSFPWIASREGYSLRESLPTAVVILLAVGFQLLAAVRVLVLRLGDRYGRSYRAEIGGGLARLGLVSAMVISSSLIAWLGVLAGALGSAVTAGLAALPKWLRPSRNVPLAPYRRKVLHYLLPTLPSALYFSAQGPLVIWLSATFGGTRNIAEVGALGRLGMVLGLFTSLIGVVFLPRLAHVVDDRLYRTRYLQYGVLLTAVAAAFLAAAALAPRVFLLLLGPHYRGLERELLLIVASSGLTLLGSYAVSINLARSWTRWQGLAVAVLVVAQAAFVATLDLSTTAGILRFGLLTSGVGLALQLIINGLGFWRPGWVRWT